VLLQEPPAVDLLKQVPKVEIPQLNKLKDLALIVRYLDVNFFNLEKELEQGKEIDPTSRLKGKVLTSLFSFICNCTTIVPLILN
jgi:hypothetical protein